MKSFEVYLPTRLVFGVGSFSRLGEFAKTCGKKALIVTTGLRKTDIIPRAQKLLADAGIGSAVYAGIEPNPKTTNIDEAVALFKKEGCDFTIGIGGGSAMDSAKNVALVAASGGIMTDYVPRQTAKIKNPTKCYPIITVSTTSGTGSETNTGAVVTNPETHEKPSMSADCMYPRVAIVDPELTVGMPPKVTAEVGMDAFFHAMEHYLSPSLNEFTELYAIPAMEWVAQYLPTAYKDPTDIEARSRIHLANTLAGQIIFIGTPSTLHAISHAIGGLTDIPHGAALAMASYAYMKYTYKGNIERYAKVARILDPSLNSASDEKAAEMSADALRAYQQKLGLVSDLKQYHFTDAQLGEIADSMRKVTPRIVSQTFVPMEREDIIEMLKLVR